MKILLLIAAALTFLLTRIRKVLAFTDGNINTAAFDATGTIPAYRDPGTRQWGTKMANNAAAAYRLGGRVMLIDNQQITGPGSYTFDSDRDYRLSYIDIKAKYGLVTQALPQRLGASWGWDFETVIQITTTQQNLDFVTPDGAWDVKAQNLGGFTIINRTALDFYFTAIVTELRKVT